MKQYIVDAFTDSLFHGNPAAVCVMEQWLSEELMRSVAMENNLSETAFAVREGDGWRLRWFTSGGEIDLCGHATLAAAYVIFRCYAPEAGTLRFLTRGGKLAVARKGERYEMDFPACALTPLPVTEEMARALGARPLEAYLGRDLLCVFGAEEDIRSLKPDLERVKALDGLLLHATATGERTDCVSRSFGPKLAVPEDPVCGSGHCHIVPYWAGRLRKNELVAYQASRRGGTLYCRLVGNRVFLAGDAVLFAEAELYI